VPRTQFFNTFEHRRKETPMKLIASIIAPSAFVIAFAAVAADKPAAKAAAQPAATVASAGNNTEAKQREAIKELLSLLNFKEVMFASSRNMRDAFPGFVEQGIISDKSLTEAQRQEALGKFAERLPALQKGFEDTMSAPEVIQGMEDLVYRVYMKHYTADDINALVAFYKSPVGQKSIRLMPVVVTETMQGAMEIMMPAAQKQAEKMLSELKKTKS
jgi:uncharacterized protein